MDSHGIKNKYKFDIEEIQKNKNKDRKKVETTMRK